MLVDDHEVVRRGLRGFLELQPDMEVVGEAPDGAIAVARAAELTPDVVLMDLLMPNMDGLTAIGTIKQANPVIEIIAVTSFIEEEKVTAALEAGASGYLLKDADAEEVAAAIRSAHNGEVHLDAEGPDSPETFSGETIDVGALAEEFFGLAIDPYPRSEGASLAAAGEPDDPEIHGPLYEKLNSLRRKF